jgi:hypothetical protein
MLTSCRCFIKTSILRQCWSARNYTDWAPCACGFLCSIINDQNTLSENFPLRFRNGEQLGGALGLGYMVSERNWV